MKKSFLSSTVALIGVAFLASCAHKSETMTTTSSSTHVKDKSGNATHSETAMTKKSTGKTSSKKASTSTKKKSTEEASPSPSPSA